MFAHLLVQNMSIEGLPRAEHHSQWWSFIGEQKRRALRQARVLLGPQGSTQEEVTAETGGREGRLHSEDPCPRPGTGVELGGLPLKR